MNRELRKLVTRFRRLSVKLRTTGKRRVIRTVASHLNQNVTPVVNSLMRSDGKKVNWRNNLRTIRFIPNENGLMVRGPEYWTRFEYGYFNHMEPVDTPEFQQWFKDRYNIYKKMGSTASVRIPRHRIIDQAIQRNRSKLKERLSKTIENIFDTAFK